MNNHIFIYRDTHSQNSTVINNQTIYDKNLTYQARFLLIWLLSIDPEEDTKLSIEEISDKTGIPLSRTRSVVQELQDARYIRLGHIKDKSYRWYIFERPIREEDL